MKIAKHKHKNGMKLLKRNIMFIKYKLKQIN